MQTKCLEEIKTVVFFKKSVLSIVYELNNNENYSWKQLFMKNDLNSQLNLACTERVSKIHELSIW